MEVRRPSLPLLPLTLLSFLAGIISQAPTPRHQASGILGGSVVLSVELSPGKNVNKIEWNFHDETGVKIQVAEFKDGGFERPDPSDRFQQRLERFDETSLRIKALEMGDSGVYEARIKIVPATVEEQAFLLTVYEPVPAPEIRDHSLSSTADGCNVTLQCQVSGREEVNVSWTRGSPPRDLGDSEGYQLAPDGRTLRLSLQPNPPSSTVTCTASNSVDQKSISLDLQSVCQSADTDRTRWMGTVCAGLTVVTAVCVGTWLWMKRQKKPAGQDQEEECPLEPHYAEIKRRSPPEGNDQDFGCPSERPLITTIYDQIRVVPASPPELT